MISNITNESEKSISMNVKKYILNLHSSIKISSKSNKTIYQHFFLKLRLVYNKLRVHSTKNKFTYFWRMNVATNIQLT